MSQARCPQCNRIGKPIAGGFYLCPIGHGQFDADDEGIVSNYTDPAKAAEAKEEYELRQRQRRI